MGTLWNTKGDLKLTFTDLADQNHSGNFVRMDSQAPPLEILIHQILLHEAQESAFKAVHTISHDCI